MKPTVFVTRRVAGEGVFLFIGHVQVEITIQSVGDKACKLLVSAPGDVKIARHKDGVIDAT